MSIMFEYVEREALMKCLEQHPDYISIVIDERIEGGRQLIDLIECGVHSPYVNDNWDGLLDVIRALDAVENQTVNFIHMSLPKLKHSEMLIYLDILRIACEEWNDMEGLAYRWEHKIDVHFYFAKELRESVESILSRQ